MSLDAYRLGPHSDVEDLVGPLTRLTNAAFAEYEGALEATEAFTEWYLRRPGSTPDVCFGAWYEGQMVSNVLVAIQSLRLGSRLVSCGIIDTVATEPTHQRRGLARALMLRAHVRMRERGAEAAVLYTNPEGSPYQFYQRLGYLTRARPELLVGPRPSSDRMVRTPTADESLALRDLVNRHYGGYEGFAPLDDDLWQWHREARPPDMPVQLFVLDGLTGCVAFAEARIALAGRPGTVSVVTDLVAPDAAAAKALLAAAPRPDLAALCDIRAAEYPLLTELGFRPKVSEVAMVLPFTDSARQALAAAHPPWYPMAESIIGV